MDKAVLDTAFRLGFDGQRSPRTYESQSDNAIIALIREKVPGASVHDYIGAVLLVRKLIYYTMAVCEGYRTGLYGSDSSSDSNERACDALSKYCPGFTSGQYQEAFAAGLFWTAF